MRPTVRTRFTRRRRNGATAVIRRVRKALRAHDCERAFDIFRFANIGRDFDQVQESTRRSLRDAIKACGIRVGKPFHFMQGAR